MPVGSRDRHQPFAINTGDSAAYARLTNLKKEAMDRSND
ncbi:hypothetical protein AVDCRST_MAG94-6410 [uncultured Leptolyngbya sp.]|uniref:Uncharacterized protein n=1 Tax=uncultured Leptolyngbya sp. TaxID=332963 RepID=A0A6J4PEI8_9CYAN|nr:hypothetical protein AVDCRST_MAG94-6410 [uncultured Leptolyngbya sp.]